MNMQKRLFAFLSVVFICVGMMAQYSPNTKWPYLYEDFADGTIFFAGNQKKSAKLNVHLAGNVLHYIADDGRVYENTSKNIVRVEIGSDAYLFSDNKLMQILETEGTNIVALLVKADFNSLLAGEGAYGSNLNSSATRNLSSLDLGGLETPEHGKMLQERNDGKTIPISKELYLIIGGKTIKATKGNVSDFVGKNNQDAFKAFLKSNKISWKSPSSLKGLLVFLSSL